MEKCISNLHWTDKKNPEIRKKTPGKMASLLVVIKVIQFITVYFISNQFHCESIGNFNNSIRLTIELTLWKPINCAMREEKDHREEDLD